MKKAQARLGLLKTLFVLLLILCSCLLFAQSAMSNIYSRRTTDLNGSWQAIVDPTGAGDYRKVWLEKKPQKKTDFVEYSFDGGPSLHVPGDFNTQLPMLAYFESSVWYRKTFDLPKKTDNRIFLYFSAVNYLADVYLNGRHIGTHEGGFTPFQFEITDSVHEGKNSLVVRVNNERQREGLPALGYDWLNYGGITREVYLVETPRSFINDYFIQLEKHSFKKVNGWVRLDGSRGAEKIHVRIPELKLDYQTIANDQGFASLQFSSDFRLWSPENPKLYSVIIESARDTLRDEIGFRCIETRGTKILLNGRPLFLKGVNIHEERPFVGGRANSEADARVLLSWATELGCNFVRLAHYPHNEHIVRLAEKMGIMVWEELPVYQNIEFSSPAVPQKMRTMMMEMLGRDRNRCAIVIWSLSNETSAAAPGRNEALIRLSNQCRLEDSTRLITSVFSNQGYQNNVVNVWDSLCRHFDLLCVNEYFGWYLPWQGKPSDTRWKLVEQMPLVISEFGGEAKYGNHEGAPDEAFHWNEEYQEQIYKDQSEMFEHIPELAGVCSWLLVDYRSPVRMHPLYQNGYNRKGLQSEFGEKKKAWYVLKRYYDTH